MIRRRADVALAALIILAATAVATWPLASNAAQRVTGHWDSFFSLWRLAWIADALPSRELHLFDAPIFHPALRTLAFSDAVLLPGLLAAPLRYAGFSPVIVYNLVLLAAFVSSGVAMFLLVRALTGRRDAAIAAAIIYTLAPYRLDHVGHLEMQMAAWLPLMFWFWHRAVDGEGPRLAGAAVGAWVLQWLSCIYYGLLAAPVFAVVILVEWTTVAKAQRVRILGALAAAAIAGVVVIGIYSVPYLANRATTGDREAETVQRYSATAWSYLAVPPHNELYGATLSRFGEGEARLFPGAIAVGLALLGLAAGPWHRRRWAYVAAGVVALDLSLGTNGVLFPILREWTIPYRGLRAPARAGILVLLVVSVLAGSGLAWLLARAKTPRLAGMITALLVALMVFEYRTKPDLWAVPASAGAPELGVTRRSVLVEMPMAVPERLDLSVDAAYMASHIGVWPRLINGYSGFHPANYLLFADRTRDFPDERSIREMARVGVTVLTVHERWFGPRYAAIVAELDSRTDVERVGRYRLAGHQVAVYQVMR